MPGDLKTLVATLEYLPSKLERAGARRQRSSSEFGQRGRRQRWLSDSPATVQVSQVVQGEMAGMLPQHPSFCWPCSPSPSLPAAVPPLHVVIYISLLHQPSCLLGHLHPKW